MNINNRRNKLRNRFIKSSRIVEASAEDMLQRAIDMSPQEREDFISKFLEEQGLRGAINIISNISKLFKTMNIPQKASPIEYGDDNSSAEITAAVGDQSFMANRRRQEQNVRSFEPGTSDIKTILNKIGDWGILLTFFTMLGMAGTSDYYSLVEKSPNTAAEIKSFLIFAGTAFVTWAVKYMASKWKTK